MRIPWYLAAIGAALIWGIHYPLIDYALKRVSLVTVLVLTALPIIAATPFFFTRIVSDYHTVLAMHWTERVPVLALAITSLLATVLLFVSIDNKNATLTSLIEISYPIFVALFAFLLFRDVHLNMSALIGGVLIIVGVGVIVLYNP